MDGNRRAKQKNPPSRMCEENARNCQCNTLVRAVELRRAVFTPSVSIGS